MRGLSQSVRQKACWIAAFSALLAAQAARAASPTPGAAAAEIRVEPKEVQVGMFYRGTKVHVEGDAPAHGKVAIVCTGHEGKVDLKRKGKVGGVLWMNVGDVTFNPVPSLFLVSSEPRGSSPEQPAPGSVASVGYDAMEARVLPASAGQDMRKLFREFIRMKEGEELYSSRSDAIRSGAGRVSADFWLPASVPPGEYQVRMVSYDAGAGEVLATQELTVKRVGLAALISSMAREHGLLYGVLSVVIAIAMGALTGVLFKASKKGH